ncbi:ExeM/NucH family extracellular endonuclease [Georgenia muralis]
MSLHHPRTRRTGAVAVAAVVLGPIAWIPAASAVTTDGPVFISELHYDNVSTDVGEAIEVQAPAGTDLTGWSLVLYNGNGGSAYATSTLTGTVPASGVVVQEFPGGIQNGAPDAVALVDAAGAVVELLSYEGVLTAADGPAAGLVSTDIGVSEPGTTPVGQSLQKIDGTWAGPLPSTFGNDPGDPGDPGPDTCGDPQDAVALVSDIQGTGATFDATCAGTQTVEAVVTALKPGLNGFYVQEEAADSDGDPLSSEGIFVFGAIPAAVEVGKLVRVTGTVGEYSTSGVSQTQLADATVEVLGDGPAVAPTPLTFPVDDPADLEAFEGMLVELTDELVISEYFNYDRFGEVVLAKPLDGQDRLHTPTAVVEPGAAAQELAAEYDRRVITLDDSSSRLNPVTLPHPGNGEVYTATNTFRGGDTVAEVQGVVDHTFGLYRVQPTTYGTYTAVNPRPEAAPAVGGSLTVASFNVLNYFLTIDDGQNDVCGAAENMECRGADNATELERQRAKILDALAELDADVVGLMEMENTPGVEPAADLAAGLNEILGAGTYDYIDTGVIGTDAIRVGMLYKPREVKPVDEFAILDSTVDPRFDDTANRPMLTQTFVEVGTGGRVTVSVNHLKSKGSACDDGSDPADGQGNCSVTRELAAEAITDFLASSPTGVDEPDHLIIGDLNSYDMEDSIDVLRAAGYTDLIKEFGGEDAYGYVFDGMVGYLDHALSNASLTSQVTGAAEWHINADEPDILDYNLDFGRPGTYFTPDRYRSSDHDAVLVGLDLRPGNGRGPNRG